MQYLRFKCVLYFLLLTFLTSGAFAENGSELNVDNKEVYSTNQNFHGKQVACARNRRGKLVPGILRTGILRTQNADKVAWKNLLKKFRVLVKRAADNTNRKKALKAKRKNYVDACGEMEDLVNGNSSSSDLSGSSTSSSSSSDSGTSIINPYDIENPATQEALHQHFAVNIQPILETKCMNCHVDGRFAMFGIKPAASSPPGPSDPNVLANYNSFFEKGLVSFESPEGAGSRLLAKIRTERNTHAGIPGVPHMNNQLLLGGLGDPTYEAFKEWILKEIPARALEGLGYYSPSPSYLCFLSRERSDWNIDPGGNGTLYTGVPAQIYCSRINNEHQLSGPLYNITALVQPALPARYDLQRLIANSGENGVLELYTSIKYSQQSNDRYNILKITVQTNSAGDIIGASSSFPVAPEYLNSGILNFRSDSIGSIKGRAADDFPCGIFDGKLLFYSNRGDPNPRNPQHPSPTNSHIQDPAIPYIPEINYAENYHGASLIEQTYGLDAQGIPYVAIPNVGTRHVSCAVGFDGKVFSGTWDNLTEHFSSWISQWFLDVNGGAELLPPLMNKTVKGALGAVRWEQMAVSSMGPVAVTQQTYLLHHGGFIQLVYHDLGVPMDNPPADQSPSVKNLRDNGAVFGGTCGQLPSQPLNGLDLSPIKSINGATFYTVSTNEVYDPCSSPPPSDLGVFHYPGPDIAPTVVFSPLQNPIDTFTNGYFVDSIALLAKKQLPPVIQTAPAPDPKQAVVHFTNVAGFITLVNSGSKNKEGAFNGITNGITHLRVFRALQRLPGFEGQGPETKARGMLARPGFEGAERVNPSIWLGDIPIQADGSVAFKIPSGIHWFWQAVREVDTARGKFKVAVFQPVKTETSKAGLNNFVGFRDMNHYRANCMFCHGADGNNVRSVQDMVENHGGTIQVDTLNTLAMQSPVDLYTNPSMKFTGFAELVQPALDSNNCVSCHHNGLTQGLSFESGWHPSATDASQSVAWTSIWQSGPRQGQPMGSEAPLSPGYVGLLSTVGNKSPYLGSYNTNHHGGAYSGGGGTSINQNCGIFLHVLGVDIGNCNGIIGLDGQAYQMPTHDHSQYFTPEQIQDFITWVDRGIDFRSYYPGELAPSYSPYAGQNRAAFLP